MAIFQAHLQSAAVGAVPLGQSAGQRTAFLCHSHLDRSLALGLQELLRREGLDLYIDWQDGAMHGQPSAHTASALRQRIQACFWFFFLATGNSMASRWCPWELGHADGTKPNERILLVPTYDGSNTHGSEYLNLYRRIDAAQGGGLAVFEPNAHTGYWVRAL
ncbi:MAG: TIR domain-containing protein [Alcaligenaceae bacterium]|nr:MAG: TIR domain-containing protein [Alcaligenaceae bacterium]